MTELDYYTPPTKEIFDDIKDGCIKIWNTYDDQFGYASEKINRIKPVENIKDNCLFMVRMFDSKNMRKLLNTINPESRNWLAPFLQPEFDAEEEMRMMGFEL